MVVANFINHGIFDVELSENNESTCYGSHTTLIFPSDWLCITNFSLQPVESPSRRLKDFFKLCQPKGEKETGLTTKVKRAQRSHDTVPLNLFKISHS